MHPLTPQQVATMLSNIINRHDLRADYNHDTMNVASVRLIETVAYYYCIHRVVLKCLYVVDIANTSGSSEKIKNTKAKGSWSCNEFYLKWPDKSIATVNGVSSYCDFRASRIAHTRAKGYSETICHDTTVSIDYIRHHPKEAAWLHEELCMQQAEELIAATAPVVSHAEQVSRL